LSTRNPLVKHAAASQPWNRSLPTFLFLPRLSITCDSTEYEMNHLYPAVAENVHECYLQKEPLLFSCAGHNTKYRRLCPCRDYREGQVALCRDCL